MRSKKGVFTCIQCVLTSQSNSSIIRAEFPMFGVFIEAPASTLDGGMQGLTETSNGFDTVTN